AGSWIRRGRHRSVRPIIRNSTIHLAYWLRWADVLSGIALEIIMVPIRGRDLAQRDDVFGMTMRPAFQRWPWGRFREVTPDIVELEAHSSLTHVAEQVVDF